MSAAVVSSWITFLITAAGGLALAALLLAAVSLATWHYANRVWRNLTAIYQLHTIQYWFQCMHKNGTHVLRKEHDEKLAATQPPTKASHE
jgi:hypothetical protein